MKKLLGLLLYLFSASLWANSCGMILPVSPGGSTDLYGRIIEKQNKDIVIQYKPGAFASAGVFALQQHKDLFMLTVANMHSISNPNKNPNVELLKVLFVIDSMIITSKDIAFADLLNKKVNVGIPLPGHTHHTISLVLKQKNPDLEIITFGADAKALISLLNGDIDAYVISSPIGNEWLKQFPKLKLLADIPFGQPFKSHGVTLESLNFFGVFMNKDATSEQKQNALSCVTRATAQPGYSEEFARIGIKIREFSDKEKDQLLERYIAGMRKVGL